MEEKTRIRAKSKRLRVTFPNMQSICFSRSTDTMIEALKLIGSEHFESIPLELSHFPLLSRENYPQFKGYMKEVCDGWYINTQSDTEQKYLQLRSISDMLNLGLIIELGEDLDITGKPEKKAYKTRKEKLEVRFPDGEVKTGHNSCETFLECLKKIGIPNLASKQLGWHNRPLFSRTKTAFHDTQIDQNWWVSAPGSTKDRAKLLRVIDIVMKLNLEVNII